METILICLLDDFFAKSGREYQDNEIGNNLPIHQYFLTISDVMACLSDRLRWTVCLLGNFACLFLYIYPSLVLVQPRKTRPCLTERFLMGRKESNQTSMPFQINQFFLKNSFRNTIRVSNSMDPDQGPNLDINCLQRLSKDNSKALGKDALSCRIHVYWVAQWLSGRVLDSRPRGRGFEPHRHHCVLEQDTLILV